jgi:4-amino-4-deoxy-L-arabinose transferase-like glycosyltransferase
VLGTADEARAVGWLLQLLPIAFVFRIRANHEQLVLFFYLAALVAAERGRERPVWFGAVGLATVGVMLVKGVFAALVPVSCALWLLWRPARTHRLRLGTWAGLALSALLALGAAAGYEYVYRGITGEPFVRPYLTQQLVVAADRHRDAESLPGVQQVRNAGWYAGRVLWYAFPWSLVCLWLLLPRTWRPRRWNAAATRNQWLFLTLAGLSLAALSLAARRADRYAFPVYYIAAVAGAMAALQRLPFMRRLCEALARVRPLEIVLVWAVTFALALAPLWHLFPKFKLVDNY